MEKWKQKEGDNKMIKCEVVENFTLENFKELKNIVRKNANVDGKLYVGDIFECSEEMAKYLDGGNVLKKKVIKIIEVKPAKKKKTKKDNK